MSSPTPGFDAFFDAVTTSPEFAAAVNKDWKGDSAEALEAGLREMQAGVEKASSLLDSFQSTFATDEAKAAGENWKQTPLPPLTGGNNPPDTKQTGTAQKDDSTPPPIEVKRFEKKDPTTWGFLGVAGMDELKGELQDSFIRPIRFKFLIQKLEAAVEQEGVESSNKLDSSPKRGEARRGVGTINTPPLTPPNLGGKQKITHPLNPPILGGEPNKIPPARDDQSSHQALLLRIYEEYQKFGVSIPTGMLFYGPPGTGKTFITKKLAEELGCGFVSKNMGEFGSSYLHQTTKNIKDFFEGVKKVSENEPIILFLDEIDSLVSARTDRVDANKAEEVSQFLQEFNSLADYQNLIVIAATNRPDHLDSALLRSGRFDKKVYLGPPDDDARKALFQMYIEKKGRPHETLDYDELMRLTTGYVSADIEAICDEVARDASRELLDMAMNMTSDTRVGGDILFSGSGLSGGLETPLSRGDKGGLVSDFSLSGENTLDLDLHRITMDSLRHTIIETPSSLKMVDMTVYEKWAEKVG